MYKLYLEKAEEPEIKLPTSAGKAKQFKYIHLFIYLSMYTYIYTHMHFCFIDYDITFECVDHKKLSNILEEMELSDHLTCLLRNLYAGQDATVRTVHGTTDWFKIWKEICQGCILSSCLFNLYAEYIIWNAGVDNSEAEIKMAGTNTNNLRYADETTEMADTTLWQKVKRN